MDWLKGKYLVNTLVRITEAKIVKKVIFIRKGIWSEKGEKRNVAIQTTRID